MALRRGNDGETPRSQRTSSPSDGATLGPKTSACQGLPPPLQDIVDQADEDESVYEDFWAQRGTVSDISVVRYAAYASRFRTLLHSMQRYAAYAYDLGQSVRPLAHPGLIRGAHAVSWGYILGDAAREARKAYRCNHQVVAGELMGTNPGITPLIEDHKAVAMQRIFFHSVASIALPTLTIRYIMKHSTNAMENVKIKALRTGGPLGLSLLVIPFFPYIFDKPIEEAVELVFFKGLQLFGGQDAVGSAVQTGRAKQLHDREAALKAREVHLDASQ